MDRRKIEREQANEKIALPKPGTTANNSEQMENISVHQFQSVVETPNANKTRH